MKSVRMTLCVMVTMAAASIGLLGCPPEVGIQLLVSPETLDFGQDLDVLVLQVSKSHSGNKMTPLIATADQPWLSPEQCAAFSDNCTSLGPLDPIQIPIRVDRNKTVFGLNVGTVSLRSDPASAITVDVVVEETAQADFTARRREAGVGQSIEFQDASLLSASSGKATSWQWHFGDGASSTQSNPTHIYSTPGVFDVSLTIKTARGLTRTVLKEAFIQVGEVSGKVDFEASNTRPYVGDNVSFVDLSVPDEGPIIKREWSFGDGATSTEARPTHAYDKPGMYSISLVITTSAGSLSGTKDNYITAVASENPLADFSYSFPYVQEDVYFYSQASAGSGPILSYKWDFGDGASSWEANPVHRYDAKGVYRVRLTVTTAHGSHTAAKNVSVNYRPTIADFEALPLRQFVGEPVAFYDRSSSGYGQIVSWNWHFGDGQTSADRNPVHAYNKVGSYTVSLEVVAGGEVAEDEVDDQLKASVVKKDYVVIVEAPEPAFTWAPLALVDRAVTFTAADAETVEPVLRYEWDFGDGTVRSGLIISHTFKSVGVFAVKLTVVTDTGRRSVTQPVAVDQGPNPAFNAEPREGVARVDRIAFSLVEQPPNARPITSYFWEFGDGNVSFDAAPLHMYDQPGVYTVRLTARFRHSSSSEQAPDLVVTSEQTGFITIKPVEPPSATISSDEEWVFLGAPVTFRVTSHSSPTSPITAYIWDLGDGTVLPPRSTPDPVTHVYQKAGLYAPTLTVEAAALPAAYRRRSTTLDPPVSIVEQSTLDEYISLDDGHFSYTAPVSSPIFWMGQQVATAHSVYRMVSQHWNPDNAVEPAYVEWSHPLTIITPIPAFRSSNTAMLFIDGGSRSSSPPLEEAMWQMALLSGTTVVHLKNVPCQPIVFSDEVVRAGQQDNYTGADIALRSRSEDAAIAYSYDRYLKSHRATGGNPTPEWPLLFPMVKSAVKAMDLAEIELAKRNVPVDGFVVAGASKRGWTTWLTGAVDPRVKAIAPIVINVLNMKDHLKHHRSVYGYWSPAIYDYAQKGVFDQLLPGSDGTSVTPEAYDLLEAVDPYSYALKRRYPMPKFMLNATGDEFFVPDTTQFYFDKLQSSKHLAYVPNVGHGMGDGLESGAALTDPAGPVGMFLAWYMATTQKKALPEFSHTFEADGSIRVVVDPDNPPASVRMWRATSQGKRDFRNPILGSQWVALPLSPQSDGSYSAKPTAPVSGNYTAFFVQLEYPNSAGFPPMLAPYLQAAGYSVPNFMVTTGVRVLPEAYPEFTGYVANDERPDAVQFPYEKASAIVVYGSPYEMGYYYGQLLANQINAFIPAFIEEYLVDTGNTMEFLSNAWVIDGAILDERLLEEIEGIAAGVAYAVAQGMASGPAVSLEQLQLAHAAAMREKPATWTTSTVMAYKQMLTSGDAAHALSINGPLYRDLHAYQCLVMYIPDNGAPHTVFTYAGLAFGRTGINLGGVSVSETYDPSVGAAEVFDPQKRNAMPVMRSVLYDGLGLSDAVALVKAFPPRRSSTVVLGDGRNEMRGALINMGAAGVVEERYDYALSDFGQFKRGIVYRSEPLLQPALQASLAAGINQVSLEGMFLLLNAEPFSKPGANLLNVAYDSSGWLLSIGFTKAEGGLEAYRDLSPGFFHMQLLLP